MVPENNFEQKSEGKELYQLKKRQRQQLKEKQRRKEALSRSPKKISQYLFSILIGIGAIGGFGWLIASRPNLPPTIIQGHIEQSPPSHIASRPIPENIQKHMLEHSDGRGAPGVIIQYNCHKFDCQPDLIEKLTALAQAYPDRVYLAPNNYDGKITLTRVGRLEILDSLKEEKIRSFIGN